MSTTTPHEEFDATAPATDATETPKLGLLYIDDEELQRRLITLILADDYEVTVAESGEEGMRILTNTEGTRAAIRIVVSDFSMRKGEMDGIDVFRQIQATRPDIAFLLVSGTAGFALDKCTALHIKPPEILEKPFSRDTLLVKLSKVLAAQGNQGQPNEAPGYSTPRPPAENI